MQASRLEQVTSADRPGPSARAAAARLGFWAAVLTGVLAAAHLTAGVLTPPRSGPFAQPGDVIPYPYTDVAAFVPGDYIWLYPGILLALAFVGLMACVHHYAPDRRRAFSQIGLSLALIYAAVIVTDYFIQLVVVQPSILSGEVAGLSLFTQYNPHGIFIGLEALGYSLMSAALLFTAPVFAGGRLAGAIRWLFVADFLLAIALFAGLSLAGYDIVAFEVGVLTINWIVLIVSGVLLSILFKRATL